jgi:hypothetical protein
MYIGPSIPGVVKKGTVFIGDLPKQLTDASGDMPEINNLVITIDKITSAMNALSQQGSVENVSYYRILEHLKGER